MAKELVRYRGPFQELDRMRSEMDRLWDSFFEDRPTVRRGDWMGEWLPSLDFSETKNDGFVKSPPVPLEAGLRFNFVVAA